MRAEDGEQEEITMNCPNCGSLMQDQGGQLACGQCGAVIGKAVPSGPLPVPFVPAIVRQK
ncbi:hypothetical protein [Kitasatospora sp. NPDC086791]|uniref:hypothetical protein n=1 Tax=Kitasatospora sp. NPDC086791 TaxID=3155178 RepID=UPI003449C5CA